MFGAANRLCGTTYTALGETYDIGRFAELHSHQVTGECHLMVVRRLVVRKAATHVIASRAAHEAAMAEAARIGPLPGIFADELLPPLPATIDMLAGAAGLLPQHQWAEMPVEQIDPRAPWRHVATARVWGLAEHGCIMIRGAGQGNGWKVVLLTQNAGRITDHLLVRAKTGSPVGFGGCSEAAEALGPVVHANGVLLPEWAWDPPPAPEGRSGPPCRWISGYAG
jgi:hypothetical protein